MISAIQSNGLMSKLSAGGGIGAIESRIQQIEGLVNTLHQTQQAPAATAFSQHLQSAGKMPPVSPPSPVDMNNTMPPSSGPISFQSFGDSMKDRAKALQPVIEQYSQQYGVDKNLVNALIRQESGFNPNARSHAGAIGLMQLMPATAKGLGVQDPSDPVQNLEGGIRHLSDLLQGFNGNVPLALAAYNAGAGAVKKYGGIPPYKETQNYVRSILANYLKDRES